jgi:hypothetical protein
MKIIDKIYNDGNTWDYYEVITYKNNKFRRSHFTELLHLPYGWLIYYNDEITQMVNYVYEMELENEYNKLKRKEKLKNILDENY